MSQIWIDLSLALVGAALGSWTTSIIKDRRSRVRASRDLEFKREQLRPHPRPTQSSTALVEEDRPVARVSHGRIYPRRSRKRY